MNGRPDKQKAIYDGNTKHAFGLMGKPRNIMIGNNEEVKLKCGCPTFITLNKLSCPSPFFSLKKSCSGYVLAMSLRMTFSKGDVFFKYSA